MSISFIGATPDTSDLTTYTFSTAAIGAAGANRTLILGVCGIDAATAFTINSMTVDGNAAAEQVDTSAFTGRLTAAAIYTHPWPTGTTADITVTFSEAVTGCILYVWAAYDLASATATDTAAGEATSGAALSLDVDVPANGVAVGLSALANGAQTFTWTGLTERSDDQQTGLTTTAADYTEDASASTPLAITADPTGTNAHTGCAAAFAVSVNYDIDADTGSYAITGSDAALKIGRKIAADAGSYSITGSAASLEFGFEIIASPGSYVLTGQDATLTYENLGIGIIADPGSFEITGSDASLELGRLISANSGTFEITGSAAQLEYGRLLSAQSGAFTITGSDATLDLTFPPPEKLIPAAAPRYRLSPSPAASAKQKPSKATHPSLTSRLQ